MSVIQQIHFYSNQKYFSILKTKSRNNGACNQEHCCFDWDNSAGHSLHLLINCNGQRWKLLLQGPRWSAPDWQLWRTGTLCWLTSEVQGQQMHCEWEGLGRVRWPWLVGWQWKGGLIGLMQWT